MNAEVHTIAVGRRQLLSGVHILITTEAQCLASRAVKSSPFHCWEMVLGA